MNFEKLIKLEYLVELLFGVLYITETVAIRWKINNQ